MCTTHKCDLRAVTGYAAVPHEAPVTFALVRDKCVDTRGVLVAVVQPETTFLHIGTESIGPGRWGQGSGVVQGGRAVTPGI